MKLEQKIKDVLEIPLTDIDFDVKQCVQICDEFAKSFTEWKDDNFFYHIDDKTYSKMISLEYSPKRYTLTELLEIYKQGL